MNAQLKMTDARWRVLAAVRRGSLHTAQTGTRDGNIVRDLVESGMLVAIRTVVPAEITYHGRRIPQATVYSRIRVAK